MQDWRRRSETSCAERKKPTEFKEIELAPVLLANLASPTLVVQARFEHQNLRTLFLQNIGLSAENIAVIPPFYGLYPDVILIRTPTGDEKERFSQMAVLHRSRQGTSARRDLIADIKHAGEANSSYSSEVVLYAVLLANWLRLQGLTMPI